MARKPPQSANSPTRASGEPREEPVIKTYSHSRLGTFETCPLQFKFRYIDRVEIEEAQTVEQFLGTLVHETLERLHDLVRSCRVLSPDEVLSDYNERWEKGWSDDIRVANRDLTPANYRELGERCLRMYCERHYPFDGGIVVGLEREIRFPLDDTHGIMGYADRIMQIGEGIYEVHDYKTSKHLPTQEKMDEDRQAGLYDLAVRHMFSDAKEVRLVWHYLRFDRRLVSTRTERERAALRDDTLRLIRRIERANHYPAHESALCDWCDYYEICPAKGHRLKVEELPPNRFLKEPGVKLVNRLAELKARLKKNEAKLGAEIAEAEVALASYAEKHGVDVVVGSTREARVERTTKHTFPRKGEQGREEVEALLRNAEKWDEVSDINLARLRKTFTEGEWPEALLGKLAGFQTVTEAVTVKLRKRKDLEE